MLMDLDLVDERKQDDVILQLKGAVTLAIAAEALEVPNGTEIDVKNNEINRVVKFNNPI